MKGKAQKALPLSALRKGQEGIIVHLSPPRPGDMEKFLTLGLIPGERLTVLHQQPLHVVQVGYTQIALDRQGAGAIYLRRV